MALSCTFLLQHYLSVALSFSLAHSAKHDTATCWAHDSWLETLTEFTPRAASFRHWQFPTRGTVWFGIAVQSINNWHSKATQFVCYQQQPKTSLIEVFLLRTETGWTNLGSLSQSWPWLSYPPTPEQS